MEKLNKTEKCFLLLVSPAVFFLIYDIFFYWAWIFIDVEAYGKEIISMMAFFSIWNIFFAFVFSRRLISSDISLKISDTLKPKFSNSISAVLLAGLSITIVLTYGGGVSFNLQESYAELATKSAAPVLVNTAIVYGLLYCVFKYKIYLISHLFILLSLISSALINGRATVIVWLIIYAVALMRHRSLKFFQVFIVIIIALTFFIITSYARGTIAIEGKDIVLESLDYNQIFTLVETIKYTQQNGLKFHLYIEDIFQGFMPRSIYPNKDTSTAFTREVFPWVWEMTSYTSGFYANLIFVFGFFGIFLTPIFLYLINKMYVYAVFQKRKNSFGQFVAICLATCPVLLVRGGVFELRIIMTVVLIALGVWVWSLISLNFLNR